MDDSQFALLYEFIASPVVAHECADAQYKATSQVDFAS